MQHTTPDGITLTVFSAAFLDWGLSITQGERVLYTSPHALSAENYGRKPHPRFDDFDAAEFAESEGASDAFIEWSAMDWAECLENEADALIEAFVGAVLSDADAETFDRAYLGAALFTLDPDCPSGEYPVDERINGAEWTESVWSHIEARRWKFWDGLSGEAREAVASDPERAGYDLWMTCEGHGCGFWDGDWPTHGDGLTQVCEAMGEDYETANAVMDTMDWYGTESE